MVARAAQGASNCPAKVRTLYAGGNPQQGGHVQLIDHPCLHQQIGTPHKVSQAGKAQPCGDLPRFCPHRLKEVAKLPNGILIQPRSGASGGFGIIAGGRGRGCCKAAA